MSKCFGVFTFVFFIFYIVFLIFPAPAARAQIVPTPGSSCATLPSAERDDCRKAICPRTCLKPGLTGSCSESEYTYSYCSFGVCLTANDAANDVQPGDPRLTAPGAIPCNYTLEDLVGAGVRVAMFIFGIAGSLALLFFVYGGYQMFTALGNPEAIMAARKTLTGAVVGLILILAAGFIVRFVGGLILPEGGKEIGAGLEVPVGSACSTNNDCGAGMGCRDGVCKTSCEIDKGAEGYFCQALSCAENSDCGAGQVCFGGGCLTAQERATRGQDPLECVTGLCPGSKFSRCCRAKPSPLPNLNPIPVGPGHQVAPSP